MPSPSKSALFSGLFVTAGIFIGGAYGATFLAEPITDAQRDFPYEDYMPSLAPGGNDAPSIPASKSATQETAEIKSSQTAGAETGAPDPESGMGLNIEIVSVRNNTGKVYILVFDDQAAFQNYDYTRASGYAEINASPDVITARFPDLTDGPYAVMMFHDEDGNQDLTLDAQGYPVEGYGTSKADSKYDDLSFKQASVKPGPLRMKMHYLN